MPPRPAFPSWSRRPRVLLAALLVVLAAPIPAGACNLDIRRIGPIELSRADLRRPVVKTVDRTAWGLDESWTSSMPQLDQEVVTRRIGAHHGVSFRTQRALSITALPPDDYGWTWQDDRDPDTPPCQLAGRPEWQPAQVRVIQTSRAVRILAAAQRTPGDQAGCELGIAAGDGALPCPHVTRVVVNLRRPLGSRTLVFEEFTEPEPED